MLITKRAIRIRISKNRQHNGEKKKVQKDKQRSRKHTFIVDFEEVHYRSFCPVYPDISARCWCFFDRELSITNAFYGNVNTLHGKTIHISLWKERGTIV